MLVDGVWKDAWYETDQTGGRFVREESRFRNWVTPDGSAGPTGGSGFRAEPGRYHLYAAWACPWAHRTLIFRKLKGLEDLVGLSVVNAVMGAEGWTFEPGHGVIPDTVNGVKRLYEIYLLAEPGYTGRVTTPVLWDKVQGTIVSNESADIIRMFNSSFDEIGAREGDYYCEALRPAIDAINAVVYDNVNNGVYKAGFATSQQAYEEAVNALFATLNELERRLSATRYLCGPELTEADWRLFTTLLRFDPVYHGHFKCNLRRLVDYPNVWAYLCELYQMPGIAETVNLEHIKTHYYRSHPGINPNGIVPLGPHVDYSAAHDRDRL